MEKFKVKEQDDTFRLEQDISGYKEYAEQQRSIDAHAGRTRQYRSFAILPDIVCVDILMKYGLDVHAPDFMNHPSNLTRLRRIIDSEYPLLKTSSIKAL
jgi:hypothetical protein